MSNFLLNKKYKYVELPFLFFKNGRESARVQSRVVLCVLIGCIVYNL